MSTPMTAAQFVTALKAEGCKVVERPGWETHNRGNRGTGWGPVHGVMMHHTVSKGELSSVELCEDGYDELPGPLCQNVIGKSATVYMVGNGRCNHAGSGDPNTFEAVKDERYGSVPPATHVHDGMSGGVDGNAHFYGAECVNMGDGKDEWPAAQLDAMVRYAAAICRFHGWTAKSVIGHSEWSDWKNDPRGPGMPSMAGFRELVAKRLANPPSWNPTGPAYPDPGPTRPPVPIPGATVTAPNRTILALPTDVTFLQNIPQTLYWEVEEIDDAGQHGTNGKTVVSNVRYNATVHLTFTGLAAGETVQVYQVEEDASGNPTWTGPAVDIVGRGDGTATVRAVVPFIDYTSNRVTFVVKSNSLAPVVMTNARVSVQSWPN